MRTIELIYPDKMLTESQAETVSAIGFFDGIHKGHQKVINTAVEIANETNRQSAVISFHPHPSVVLKKDVTSVAYISTLEEKMERLEALGVDVFYIIKFDKTLSKLEPELFLNHFIRDLNITHLVAGFDYTFGFKGKGNMKNIDEFARFPLETTVIEKVNLENEKISSTRIRKALAAGHIAEANSNLGRCYAAEGKVVQGDQRGREMGYPTANLEISEEKLLPRVGIYAVEVEHDGKIYEAMASLGYNPTFKDDSVKPILEVNIFDFDKQIYGEKIKVYWHKYVRDEVKFSSMDEIIAQIAEDEKEIKAYFKN